MVDSSGKEAVPESICSDTYGPEAPATGPYLQQVEGMEAGVGGVFQDVVDGA